MKSLFPFLILISLFNFAHAGTMLKTVPDVKQTTDYTCGIASLAAVLGFYGINVTEEQLLKETYIDPEVGVAIAEIIKAGKRRGFTPTLVENASLEKLEDSVNNGQLTIILSQAWRAKSGWFRRHIPWEEEWDAGHYMVVIGYDEENIYFEDPWILGTRGFIPRDEFLKRWHGPSDSDVPTQRQAIFFEGSADLTKKPLRLKSQYIE